MKTTIEIRNTRFDVEYDYSPPEPMVMYFSDGSGYPGSPEEVSVTKIIHDGVDLTDFVIACVDYDEIEEVILKQLHQ